MTTPHGHPEATRATPGAVVVGIDGSASAERAAIWAGTEALRRGRPLRLVQVYAVPQVHTPIAVGTHEQVRAGLTERAEGWLAEAGTAVLAESPGVEIGTAAREWSPVAALVQESRRAELVVLGSPATGPVIVGADGSSDSDNALAFACEEARLRGVALTVVHTWSDLVADEVLRPHPFQDDAAGEHARFPYRAGISGVSRRVSTSPTARRAVVAVG